MGPDRARPEAAPGQDAQGNEDADRGSRSDRRRESPHGGGYPGTEAKGPQAEHNGLEQGAVHGARGPEPPGERRGRSSVERVGWVPPHEGGFSVILHKGFPGLEVGELGESDDEVLSTGKDATGYWTGLFAGLSTRNWRKGRDVKETQGEVAGKIPLGCEIQPRVGPRHFSAGV